ncbi:MAG: NUDIX domain-containing protein [Oscillospiraceae bacterium]|jgi:8-oxo-dGTP pyrophosphatase MutT (NUDIX family)|nr:NUDIX domain-containing protein [Oscillospiraceae bacterium]
MTPFEIALGSPNPPPGSILVFGESARAVALRDGRLLQVREISGAGFPGGGVQRGETPEEAVRREVLEETGYAITRVGACIGIKMSYLPGTLNFDGVFWVVRHWFFLCEVEETPGQSPALEGYEKDYEMHAAWLTPEEAMEANARVIAQDARLAETARQRMQTLEAVVGALGDSGFMRV